MERSSKHMEPQENFFERTWGAFKRLSTLVKVLIVAAPFVLGIGIIVVSFIALKNYQEEQLKSEIIEFVKNSHAMDSKLTVNECIKGWVMQSDQKIDEVYGWGIRNFKHESDKHTVYFTVIIRGKPWSWEFDVFWSQKIVINKGRNSTKYEDWLRDTVNGKR